MNDGHAADRSRAPGALLKRVLERVDKLDLEGAIRRAREFAGSYDHAATMEVIRQKVARIDLNEAIASRAKQIREDYAKTRNRGGKP